MNYKKTTPVISEAKVQEILLNYLNKKRLFNKLALNDIRIRSMHSHDAIFYFLQSSRISRNIVEKFTAKLQPFDNLNYDYDTGVTNTDFSVKSHSCYEEKNVVVPNTEKIKLCHTCEGKKSIKCKKCTGSGSEMCWHCYGVGLQCYHCNFRGTLSCESCSDGKVTCYTCEGYGSVKWFKELQIKKDWVIDEYIKSEEVRNIPEREIKRCKGECIVNENNKKVVAINHFPDDEINKKSKEFISRHQNIQLLDSTCDIVSQYHSLRAIPVTKCVATYKNKPLTFYIIGKDNCLYVSKDYNSSCIVV